MSFDTMTPTAKKAQAQKQIEALAKALATKGEQNINWGHVGDMGRLIEILEEALKVAQ